jgi:hypothetical protein
VNSRPYTEVTVSAGARLGWTLRPPRSKWQATSSWPPLFPGDSSGVLLSVTFIWVLRSSVSLSKLLISLCLGFLFVISPSGKK